MSGYDKSPDYGGPEPSWRENLGAFLLFLAVGAICVGLFHGPSTKCREIQQADSDLVELDGKTVRHLDLAKIPRGECVTIKP
jgi:hypothetical protein